MPMLKVISALLTYPRAEIQEALPDMADLVNAESKLAVMQKAKLSDFIESLRCTELMEWQQNYADLFDRGRHLSLHLFEHIHGESRDRGQAMVELMRIYQSHGYEIDVRELPDYIPLFLEFLSRRPADEAAEWLRGSMPVLQLLGARLAERGSSYAALFDALGALAGVSGEGAELRQQVATEGPDDTLVRMDEIWEEEAVRFMGNPDGCRKPAAAEQPVVFHRHQPNQRRVG
jgi:nitrate reductase delta subunit